MSKEGIKLSFVVPVHKPDHGWLKKCIKSLGKQSLKETEVIFIMDGLDDEAQEVISKETKKYNLTTLIVSQGHLGASAARNKGAGYAMGQYIVFWDCDCVIEPDAAKMWVEFLDENKDYDFIYSGYKFEGNKEAINSQPFDPWLLEKANYISTCFPLRREKLVKWDESLESLQDWDFWLKVVKNGSKGYFVSGYAFETALPTKESISGRGCSPQAWLERVSRVKERHDLPDLSTCVTSVSQKWEAIRLAKLLGADYQDPGQLVSKPHKYETIIQVGYSLMPDRVEAHAQVFGKQDIKRVIFWTPGDIAEIQNAISLKALKGDRYNRGYVELINKVAKQFVEDKEAKYLMDKAGFDVSVLSMPMKADEVKPLPKKAKFLVETQSDYGEVLNVVQGCLPDIELAVLRDTDDIEEYTGLIHYYTDRSLSGTIKRAILAGRHVISNVQYPGAGYLDDRQSPDVFIPKLVDKIRELTLKKPSEDVRKGVIGILNKRMLEGALK